MENKIDGCEPRHHAGRMPAGIASALRWHKGNSSSSTNTPVNNNQVAVQGSGSAVGAVTTTGAGSSVSSGGQLNNIRNRGSGTVNITTTNSDASVVQAALDSNNALIGQAASYLSTLTSQVVSAFTNQQPQVAQGLTSPNYATGAAGSAAAGNTGTATASQAATDNSSNASSPLPLGLSGMEWLGIVGIAVSAVAIILVVRK